ncbi:cytoplasmic dynein 2 intermediate chain 2-like [Dysidea avara]|uniref:cytoplasmic dynein 2 intermediate chain 2-like n=1 Tax=Dysidea avara TaxID=196820 RepID=UPI00331AA4D5
MFQDNESDLSVFWDSNWKTSTVKNYASTQTSEILTNEAETQSHHLQDFACQCAIQKEAAVVHVDEKEVPGLCEFLQRVEPKITACLKENLTSHAFDGYEVLWEDQCDSAHCIYTLTDPGTDGLQCTDVSWSSSGAMLVASYGRHDHENWCTHKGLVCMWNLSSGKLTADKADSAVDVDNCVMCVACYPSEAGVIAGGTFSGEVKVWHFAGNSKWVVVSSSAEVNAHKEPVTSIRWLSSSQPVADNNQLVSLASDGCVILWKIDLQAKKVEIVRQFTLHVPGKRVLTDITGSYGGTCLTFPYQDNNTFVAGCETGSLFKCSLHVSGEKTLTQSPVTFSFQPHNGPVYDVQCSPYHRNLFLSCGTNSTCQLYSLIESQPLLSLTPSYGYLFSASWSPSRPCVFAVGSQQGYVLVYDLAENMVNPVIKLASDNKKLAAVYCVKFNRSRPHILASGDEHGIVRVWHVSSKLALQQTNELEVVNTIAEP